MHAPMPKAATAAAQQMTTQPCMQYRSARTENPTDQGHMVSISQRLGNGPLQDEYSRKTARRENLEMNQPTLRMIGMLLIAAAERMEETELTFGAVLDGFDADLLSTRISSIDKELARSDLHLLQMDEIENLARTDADTVVDILRTATEQ